MSIGKRLDKLEEQARDLYKSPLVELEFAYGCDPPTRLMVPPETIAFLEKIYGKP